MNRNYEAIVHMLPDIIYKLDADGHFLYVNNSIRNLGYEPGDLIFKHFSMLVHPDDISNVQRNTAISNVVVTGAQTPKLFDERRTGKRITRDLKVRLIPKDSSLVKNEHEIVACCNVIAVGQYHAEPEGEGREFTGTLGVIRDIMNVRKNEDSLLRCIDYYQYLVEISNDIFFVLATDGTILFTSQSLTRNLGYRNRDVAGESIIDYLHEDCLKSVLRAYSSARPSSPDFSVMGRIQHRDGTWRTAEIQGKVAFDERGRSLFISAVTRDITRSAECEDELRKSRIELEARVAERTAELARANEQLMAEIQNRSRQEAIIMDSERKYRNLINTIDDMVLNIDPEGVILFVNPAVRKITGYAQEEMIGRNLLEFIYHGDIEDFLYRHRQSREASVHSKKSFMETICGDNELRLVKKDGAELWVDMCCHPVLDRAGSVQGLRGIAHDITRRKQAEDDLMRFSKIESLGILAAGIAHDFNNLLTAIMGNISLAKVTMPKEDPGYGILTEAEKASSMARNLTHQLMAFSRGGSPVRKITSIQNLLVDTAYFVLRGSSISCTCDVPDSLWDADIDRGQIAQVIHNLILNARQAMPDGGKLAVRAENVVILEKDSLPLQEGKYIKISIVDQGNGIPAEIIPRIFDPYFSTKVSGTGLGLAICYSIVKKHDGHIAVDSGRGSGSTFSVYIPASRQKAVLKLGAVNARAVAGGKILLMDDEPIILDLGAKLLRHLGHEVVTAMHGAQAAAIFQEAKSGGAPFDVIILDLIIPGGIGADKVIDVIKKIDPGVRAIVTSGYADDPIIVDYQQHGFAGAMAKPFNLEELEREIARVLSL
jgi:PAS domain S-box-containing protein